MAALERPVPSPEAFLGQPWAAWVREAALPHAHCAAPPHSVELEDNGKEGGKSREVMRLNKEDMHLFGHYPAHDDFYLVVCNICNQVVKPQVFQSHCGRLADVDLSHKSSHPELTPDVADREILPKVISFRTKSEFGAIPCLI